MNREPDGPRLPNGERFVADAPTVMGKTHDPTLRWEHDALRAQYADGRASLRLEKLRKVVAWGAIAGVAALLVVALIDFLS